MPAPQAAAALPAQRREVDVFEVGCDRLEARAGLRVGDTWISVRPPTRRVEMTSWAAPCASSSALAMRRAPDAALRARRSARRRALRARCGRSAMIAMSRAEVGHVVDDVGREDHDDVLADLGEQVEEAVALLGVEARGRLVDDDQLRVADQRLRDAEALAHAAREAGERLLAHVPEVGLLQQRLDRLAALAARRRCP